MAPPIVTSVDDDAPPPPMRQRLSTTSKTMTPRGSVIDTAVMAANLNSISLSSTSNAPLSNKIVVRPIRRSSVLHSQSLSHSLSHSFTHSQNFESYDENNTNSN